MRKRKKETRCTFLHIPQMDLEFRFTSLYNEEQKPLSRMFGLDTDDDRLKISCKILSKELKLVMFHMSLDNIYLHIKRKPTQL